MTAKGNPAGAALGRTSVIPQRVFPETDHLRRQVQDTRQAPYNAVGRIRTVWSEQANDVSFGTGFVVELNNRTFVLTVAHNFWSRDRRLGAREATFNLGLNALGGNIQTLGLYNAVRWWLPEEYSRGTPDNAFLYDYALVQLNADELPSILPLYFNADIVNKNIFVTGYPGDKSPACDQMWNAPGTLRNDNLHDPLLFHNASTEHGNSGSPIFGNVRRGRDNTSAVIGVHSRVFSTQDINAGRRLDDDVENQLLAWVR